MIDMHRSALRGRASWGRVPWPLRLGARRPPQR